MVYYSRPANEVMSGFLVYSVMFRAENEASKLTLEHSKHVFRVEELQEKQRR